MFKFNFNADDVEEQNKPDSTSEEKQWLQAQKHITPKDLEDNTKLLTDNQIITVSVNQTQIRYININEIKSSLQKVAETSTYLNKAFSSHSDLVPSVYEGGLKIWECTWDLLEHIFDIDFKSKRVLDLGCGAGIVGIYAMMRGAQVVFQDYNKEVIDNITTWNVYLNSPVNASFYSGDWSSLADILHCERSFDFILSSETIYNEDCYHKLLSVFKSCLKPGGCVILAAKTYYFGVGGSTVDFCDFVNKESTFNVTSSISHSEGVQREILTLKHAS